MGLLTKPANVTDNVDTWDATKINNLYADLYNTFGSTVGSGGTGEGTVSNDNIAASAAIRKGKIADTAMVLTNTVEAGVQTVVRPTTFGNASTPKVQAGTGTAEAQINGVISVNTTAVGNFGAAGPDDLISYSLPANTLVNTARGLRITAWGDAANNANAKAVNFKFGSVTLGTYSLQASNAITWVIEALIIRTGTSLQEVFIRFHQASIAGSTFNSTYDASGQGEVETAAITIKCQATTSTADNDVYQRGLMVEAI